MRNPLLPLLNNLNYLICGHDRKFVMLSIIYWTTYFKDLAQNYIEKGGVFSVDTNRVTFFADLFLLCYERDFMLSLSDNNLADVIEAFNSTSRYLDDLLNIENPYFEQI